MCFYCFRSDWIWFPFCCCVKGAAFIGHVASILRNNDKFYKEIWDRSPLASTFLVIKDYLRPSKRHFLPRIFFKFQFIRFLCRYKAFFNSLPKCKCQFSFYKFKRGRGYVKESYGFHRPLNRVGSNITI